MADEPTELDLDSDGRPIAGSDSNGHFTVSEDGSGNQVITYDDGSARGTTIVQTTDGRMISTTTPDGTFVDWHVELGELGQAAQVMPQHVQVISAANAEITKVLTLIRQAWQSPVVGTFDALVTEFKREAAELEAVLTEAATRMKLCYDNIVSSETIAAYGKPEGGP